jgi:xylan 1,4-beta-xylosidase
MNTFELNAQSKTRPFPHYWELCVGSCHGTTALREDYRRQLEKCSRELGFKYVRFHGLFDDDMSVLIKSQGFGSPPGLNLSFTNIDSIFDFLLSINMKPFVELGFMPGALTSGSASIFHYKALTSPPDDYDKWRWFISQFAVHCVERYGLDEVRQWFFEVWNEPNLGGPDSPMSFWGGTQEEYFKLYEASARALKAVDQRLRVGGPATSENAWIPEFVAFCKKNNVPVDFISTHHYATDDIARVGITELMKMGKKAKAGEISPEAMQEIMANYFAEQASVWQKVERGRLTRMAEKAKAEADGLPLYYTEWNSMAGIQSDGPFGAAFLTKTIMDNTGLVEGYSYWTFTDIFEEAGMPHKEFHGGYGLLTLHGVPKAPYRAFELLHKLGDKIYEQKYSRGTVDVYAVSKDVSGAIQIVAVNEESFQRKISSEKITVKITGMKSFAGTIIQRVDEEHGNAIRQFDKLGAPDYVCETDLHELLAASGTKVFPLLDTIYKDETVELSFELPAQGVALITVFK